MAGHGGHTPFTLNRRARFVVGILGVECAAIAWSLWTRPPVSSGRTSLTILDSIPVLSTLWPWLFAAGAVVLIPTAAAGWGRWLHVILSLGGGVHISYGLASLAVSVLNETGWVVPAISIPLGMFYLLSALWVARDTP